MSKIKEKVMPPVKPKRVETTNFAESEKLVAEGYRVVEVRSAKAGSRIEPETPKTYVLEK